jgi:alkylation response protein AidB-like acyl-CoA dehydrogenase
MCTQVTDRAVSIARDLADAFALGAADRDLHRAFPHHQLANLRASGLEALVIPPQYGGWGGSYADAVRVVETLATGDPNIAQMYLVHIVGVALVGEISSRTLMTELYERTARGQLRWTNAYAELNTRNVLEYKVKLSPSASRYLLNGEKFYSTGSLGGDEIYVTAVLDGTDRVQIAFVPAAASGVTIIDDWYGMGQVTTASGTVRFENVVVPAERVVPGSQLERPDNLYGPTSQLMISGVYLGIARNALSDAMDYVVKRARPWPLGNAERASDDPYVVMHIGEMQTLVSAAGAIQSRAIDYLDAGFTAPSGDSRAQASVAVAEAKAFTTTVGLKVSEMLFQVCGSSSTLKKYNYERHWRNVRTLTLHDPVDYKFKLIGEYYLSGRIPPVSIYT